MSSECIICCANIVDKNGNICELCSLGQDPYASSLNEETPLSKAKILPDQYASDTPQHQRPGRSRKILLNGGVTNTDPYGNELTSSLPTNDVKVYQPGQVPVHTNTTAKASGVTTGQERQPLTSGITKNITTDLISESHFVKWIRSFFSGIPFTIDNDVTSFQVFPDFSGTSTNMSGNACDQVILYGKITAGMISENNNVEVYGKRDADNNIVATSIRNIASGTTVSPSKVISATIVRLITLGIICFIVWLLYSITSATGESAPIAIGQYVGAVLIAIILMSLSLFLFKNIRLKKWAAIFFIAAISVLVYVFFPDLLARIIGGAVTIGIIFLVVKLIFKK